MLRNVKYLWKTAYYHYCADTGVNFIKLNSNASLEASCSLFSGERIHMSAKGCTQLKFLIFKYQHLGCSRHLGSILLSQCIINGKALLSLGKGAEKWVSVSYSAGKLLKFCCRASTEYQVVISDSRLTYNYSLFYIFLVQQDTVTKVNLKSIHMMTDIFHSSIL